MKGTGTSTYNLVIWATIIAVMIFASSCVKDESPLTTQVFSLDTIMGVDLSIAANVRIVEGESQMVEITGREEALHHLNRTVVNGIWDIDLSDRYRKQYDELEIIITSNDIESLAISGAGNINNEHILPLKEININGSGNITAKMASTQLRVDISGSGNLTISGETDDLRANTSGSGNLNTFDLLADTAEISISGQGNSRVHIISSLEANITGVGNIYYKGNPTINSRITGLGRLINAN